MTTEVSSPVDAAARLRRLTDLATPFAVRVVATLGVVDLMESGVHRLDDLAGRCGADRGVLGRLLRYLVHRDLFVETATDMFEPTEVGRLLRSDDPDGKQGRLHLDSIGARMDLAYGGLLHSARTGEPAYAAVHGRSFWADLDANPDFRRYFDDLMRSQQHATAPQVAARYDWSRVRHVVDVGGGSGALLAEVLASHPHLRGTVVDRAEPVSSAAERFSRCGIADRAGGVVGDFFDPLPAGADVYVVSRVLTDWNDRAAAAILRRCAEAAGATGRVLVVEVLPTEPHVPGLSAFDLTMLAVVGGRERTLADFAALAGNAGLRVTDVTRGDGGLVLIECAVAPSVAPAADGR